MVVITTYIEIGIAVCDAMSCCSLAGPGHLMMTLTTVVASLPVRAYRSWVRCVWDDAFRLAYSERGLALFAKGIDSSMSVAVLI